MSRLTLLISDLLLDSDNPRIDTADSQRDALQKILDDQGDKLYELAEDIVSEGLSPIDRLLVLREDKSSKRYLALEGNRRVAVLKILSNVNVLAGLDIRSPLRKRFELLASQFDRASVEPVDAFEVPNRDAGRRWIYLRHTGENQGRGVVGWTGVAAARFRGEDPALQALEFVRAHGQLRDEQKALLGHYFPITTLDRLLSTPEVRKLIGVDVVSNKLTTTLPATEVIKPLRRLVLDLAEKNINVSGLKNRSQQVDYVSKLAKEDRPDFVKAVISRPIETIKAAAFASPAAIKSTKRKAAASIGRRTVIPSRMRLNVTDPKAARILAELQKLKADETPNAGAVLLRVFLELSVDAFLDSNGIQRHSTPSGGRTVEKSLSKKVEETIDYLVTAKGANRKDFLGVSRGLSVASSPFSIDLLNAYVHNRFVTPKTSDLLSAWDDAQPFFGRIWE